MAGIDQIRTPHGFDGLIDAVELVLIDNLRHIANVQRRAYDITIECFRANPDDVRDEVPDVRLIFGKPHGENHGDDQGDHDEPEPDEPAPTPELEFSVN